jgi:hypothetical protein
MGDRITYVGLDVHKEGIVVAVAEGGLRGEVREYGRIANTPAALERLAGKFGAKLRFCYEDGVIPARRFRSGYTRWILRRDGAPSHQPEDPLCTTSA